MPTHNVNLSPQQAKFIRQRIDKGDFRNASEVVRAGLRLLEQQEEENVEKLRVLRGIIKEAMDQIARGKFLHRFDGRSAASAG